MTGVEPPELRTSDIRRSVFSTALLYVIASGLWILLSDELVSIFVPPGLWQVRLSIVKGWLFVLVTGAMLCALLARHARLMVAAERRYRDELEEVDRQKRVFFQNTISAITEGKLLIRDPAQIGDLLPPAQEETVVSDASEAPRLRARVKEAMAAAGFPAERVQDFVVAVGEAITNAIKHAGGGVVSLHARAGCFRAVVADRGSGISDLMLPRAVLERGYSTKPSLGMGYTLMLSLADRVYLSTGPAGTTVVLEACAPK